LDFFWYCCVPSSYLTQLRDGENFKDNQMLEYRGYEGHQQGKVPKIGGLDLMVPSERLLAFQLLWGIIAYVGSGCTYIGSYDTENIISARKSTMQSNQPS